jgi:hypothetical protein
MTWNLNRSLSDVCISSEQIPNLLFDFFVKLRYLYENNLTVNVFANISIINFK